MSLVVVFPTVDISTLDTLSVWTDRPEQTVLTQIKYKRIWYRVCLQQYLIWVYIVHKGLSVIIFRVITVIGVPISTNNICLCFQTS